MSWPSKRSNINHTFPFEQGVLVDQTYGGNSGMGPFSASYATGGMYNEDNIDDNGFPNNASLRTRAFGGFGISIPASTDFAGPYVKTWDGGADFNFQTGTWTVNVGLSSNYAESSNGRYTGTDPRVVLTYSGAAASISSKFNDTDHLNVGDFVTNTHFYRLEDEARFLAGKKFRLAELQSYVDLGPSSMRFMNWGLTNGQIMIRAEHRKPPNRRGWGGIDFLAYDTYGETAGANQMTIANSAGSPVAYRHGEIITARIGSGMVRASSGAKAIVGITKANPGVANVTAHGYNTGDKIIHRFLVGMTQLDFRICIITVTDADHYEIGIDTTSFTTFTSGSALQYISLDRGGLGAKPVVFAYGDQQASQYGNNYIRTADYKTFVLDKELVAGKEADGTVIQGAWVFPGNTSEASDVLRNAVPWEVMTAFMNELNEILVAAGKRPADMWVCVPLRSMMSVDPDYSVASHCGIQMCNVILNGANGYAGLKYGANINLELDNETWNSGSAFHQTSYNARRAYLRWGLSTSDYGTWHALRAAILAEDIRAAFPNETRIKVGSGLQGFGGVSGSNNTRLNGSATLFADPLYPWGSEAPKLHMDFFCPATYFVPSSAYDTANLATFAASWAAAPDQAAKEVIFTNYLTGGFLNGTAVQSVDYYIGTLIPAYTAALAGTGAVLLCYEGWWDKTVTGGTSQVNAFLVDCKKSQALADLASNFLTRYNAIDGAYSPAGYIRTDDRWGFSPSPNTYFGGVEGAALSLAWNAWGDYNDTIAFDGRKTLRLGVLPQVVS